MIDITLKKTRFSGSIGCYSPSLSNDIRNRYHVKTVLVMPKLLHAKPNLQNDKGVLDAKRNIQLNMLYKKIFLKFNLRKSDRKYASLQKRLNKMMNISSMFKENNALNELLFALWQIYRSNNLQLSQSLFELINLITERKEQKRLVTLIGLTHVANLQKRMVSQLHAVDFAMLHQISHMEHHVPVLHRTLEMQKRYAYSHHQMENETNTIAQVITNANKMSTLLGRIYEEIETSTFLYNESSYKNTKTLFRLTNSLWKVYRGQNLELSRSFTRLITRISDEHIQLRYERNEQNMFQSTRSLKSLVNAMRRAFSGTNLEMRHSMISLFSDVHRAGEQNHSNNISKNNISNQIFLYYLPRPSKQRHIPLRHRENAMVSATGVESRRGTENASFERDIERKISELEHKLTAATTYVDNEVFMKNMMERIEQEQQTQWRMEKMQRGIF